MLWSRLGAAADVADAPVAVRVTTSWPGVSPESITVLVSSESPVVTTVFCGGTDEEMVKLAAPARAPAVPLKLRVVLPVPSGVEEPVPDDPVLEAKLPVLPANRDVPEAV